MKLNNKGFAISGILYSILILFLVILVAILGVLGSRKVVLDKNKMDTFNMLNETKEEIIKESYNIKLVEYNDLVNEYEVQSENEKAVLNIGSCKTNPICECDNDVRCNVLEGCQIEFTNVKRNSFCTLKYN